MLKYALISAGLFAGYVANGQQVNTIQTDSTPQTEECALRTEHLNKYDAYEKAKKRSDRIVIDYKNQIAAIQINLKKAKEIQDKTADCELGNTPISEKEILSTIKQGRKSWKENDVLWMDANKCGGIWFSAYTSDHQGFILTNGKTYRSSNIEPVIKDIEESYDAKTAQRIDDWYTYNYLRRTNFNITKKDSIDPLTLSWKGVDLHKRQIVPASDLKRSKKGIATLKNISNMYGYENIDHLELIKTAAFKIGEFFGVYRRLGITYTYAIALCPTIEERYAPVFQEPTLNIEMITLDEMLKRSSHIFSPTQMDINKQITKYGLQNDEIYFYYSPQSKNRIRLASVPESMYDSWINYGDGSGWQGLTQQEAENLFPDDVLKSLADAGQTNVTKIIRQQIYEQKTRDKIAFMEKK